MLDVFSAPSNAIQQGVETAVDYVLIDGSKRAESERWLYQLFETPDYRNIFDGTEWASIRQVAPILVRAEKNHPNFKRLLTELQEFECGYGLTSVKSLDAVADHLSRFIEVRHPLGHNVLLRFSDPAIARVLLASPEWGGVPEFGAGMTGTTVPDYLWGEWHVLGCPDALLLADGSLRNQGGEKYGRLSDLTISQLVEVDRRTTLVKLLKHLENYFPDQLAGKPKADVITELRSLMNEAIRNGYTSLQALTHWCTVFGCLGRPESWDRLAPDVYEIYPQYALQTSGPEARKAAVRAMELAQIQNAGRAEKWA